MGRIYAIAINTFREAVRDRILNAVLFCAVTVLLFTLFLGELSLNEQRRVVMDVGLASMTLFSVVMAVFLGSSLLYKEIERKTLYVILPKPIRRWEFLLGKYLGITLTVTVFITIMAAVQIAIMGVQAGMPVGTTLLGAAVGVGVFGAAACKARDRTKLVPPTAVLALAVACLAAGAHGVQLEPLLASVVLTIGEVFLLAAVAVFFSSFSTPFLTGLLTLGVWLIGRSADEMATMRSRVVAPEIRSVLRAMAEVVPNFNLFVPGHQTLTEYASGYGGAWSYTGTTLGYGMLYSAVLLLAASWVFRRRDFL